MRIIGIDPGTTRSAYVVYRGGEFVDCGLEANALVAKKLIELRKDRNTILVLERIKCQGAMASDSVFATCAWSGIFLVNFGINRSYALGRRKVLSLLGISGGSTDLQVRTKVLEAGHGQGRFVKDIWQAAGLVLGFLEVKDRNEFKAMDFLEGV